MSAGLGEGPEGSRSPSPQDDVRSSEDTPAMAEPDDAVLEDQVLPAVQVCVRCRPLLSWEKSEGQLATTLQLSNDGDGGNVLLKPSAAGGSSRTFRFNAVVDGEKNQQDAWELSRIDGVVNKVALGFHATVFAYGQTGTGKTHTMEGFAYEHHNGSSAPSAAAARPRAKVGRTAPEQLGIVPRAVHSLFTRVEALRAKAEGRVPGTGAASCVVKVSFLQIYNEKIFDLLNPSLSVAQRESGGRGEDFAGLRMRWNAAKRSFFVENLFQYECSSAEEVLQHYHSGVANKQVASTAMNVASSRSHTLLVLTLVRREGLQLSEPGNNAPPPPCQEVVSKLALVDLAGSERTAVNSGFEKSAARFNEAVNVNQSLFVLRKVITALSKRADGKAADSGHVPYRESKLTSLLQHALGGNSYLVMFACLAPSDRHYEENLSTLQYASQAAAIKNQPSMNVDPKDRLIKQVEARLAAAHSYLLRVNSLDVLPQELLDAEEAAAAAVTGRKTAAPVAPARRAKSARQRSLPEPAETSASWQGAKPRPLGRQPKSEAKAESEAQVLAAYTATPGGATLARIARGTGGGPSPRSAAWPATFSSGQEVRNMSSTGRSEGRELFAEVDALMRDYDGSGNSRSSQRKPSPRKPLRPPSLPPASFDRSDVLPPVANSPMGARQGPSSSPARKPPVGSAVPAPKFLEADTPGRDSPGDVDSLRSTFTASPATVSTAPSRCSCCEKSGAAEAAAAAAASAKASAAAAAELALLEAVEEIKVSKSELEASKLQLREANARAEALEVEAEEAAAAAVASAKAARLERATQAEAAKQAQEEKEALTAAKEGLGEEKEAVSEENEKLRREKAEMQQQLDVFFKAMALEPAVEEEKESKAAGIGKKIEKLHSQLVLEAVSLRNEVAKMKKKKWILQAVLDNGGENERKAIDQEIEQLRRLKKSET
mmetsp:Transcript_57434/g.101951  ORF Transcript_57434/g.101951 Transcript_57434/m.101951 type:complete len:943 (+) Transcript_57434:56-2884(+)